MKSKHIPAPELAPDIERELAQYEQSLQGLHTWADTPERLEQYKAAHTWQDLAREHLTEIIPEAKNWGLTLDKLGDLLNKDLVSLSQAFHNLHSRPDLLAMIEHTPEGIKLNPNKRAAYIQEHAAHILKGLRLDIYEAAEKVCQVLNQARQDGHSYRSVLGAIQFSEHNYEPSIRALYQYPQ